MDVVTFMPDTGILNWEELNIEQLVVNVKNFGDYNVHWKVFLDFLLV